MYHIKIDEEGEHWLVEGIEDMSYSAIKEVILNNLTSELASLICSFNPEYVKAEGCHFEWNDQPLYDMIRDRYADRQIAVLDDEDRIVATYASVGIYAEAVEDYMGSENSDIEICSLWSRQLGNFIEQSKWQVALKTDDGSLLVNVKEWPVADGDGRWFMDGVECHPLMWFGIEGKEIHDEWTVRDDGIEAIVSEEDGMGDYGGQMNINGFEVNYLDFFEGFGSWYFGACGEAGADFTKVVNTCPIDLLSLYENKDGCRVVRDYCLKLQRKR